MGKRLTQKQEDFIRYYIETGNGTLSAISAGYCTNRNTAAVIASENLRKPNVLARLNELRDEIYGPRKMALAERVARLSELAREDNPGNRGYQRQPNIQAIDTLNKMERIYAEEGQPPVEIVQSFTFILPNGTKVTPRQLIEGIKNTPDSPQN